MRSTLGMLVCLACFGSAWAAEPSPAASSAQEGAAPAEGGVDLAALAQQRLARVGDREINALAFQREMEFQAQVEQARTGEPPVVDREFRARAMRSLIEHNLLQLMAKNARIEVPEAEVTAELAKRKRLFLNEAAYADYLARLGYTETLIGEEVKQALTAQRFVEQKTEHITASQEAALAEYQRLRVAGQMTRKERTADLRHILMRAADATPESWDAAEMRINAAHARVLAGETFEAVAKDVSEDFISMEQGGLYEEATASMVLPEFAERLFTQPPGVVSAPFKSRMGWHILKIEAVQEPGTIPFERVRSRLERAQTGPARSEVIKELLTRAASIYRVEVYPAESAAP